MRRWNTLIRILLCIAAFAMTPSFGSWAAGEVVADNECQLTLEYRHDGTPLPDMTVRIYRVADITAFGEYVLSGVFAGYPVNVENLDDVGWRAAAKTLAAYVSVDHVEALRTGQTSQQGLLEFAALETGLYLAKAENKKLGGRTYRSDAFLVSLPSIDGNKWNYVVKARPKTSVSSPGGNSPSGENPSDSPDQLKRTVIKVWNDQGHEAQRPDGIRAALYKNGERYDSVILNASNYWRHTWSGLSSRFTWEVIEEDVADPYFVTYQENGSIHTITNSMREEILEPDIPLTDRILPDGEVPLAALPKTGLLWWPVPFLVIAGLLLCAVGYRESGGRKNKHDESQTK